MLVVPKASQTIKFCLGIAVLTSRRERHYRKWRYARLNASHASTSKANDAVKHATILAGFTKNSLRKRRERNEMKAL